ncbi:hypothetical protein GGQ85_000622 [Nitrobacter vulgaris]|nr:hypothetical protein [Nitrobacter vulgaris]
MFGFGVERHRRSTPKVFPDAKSGETWVKYELYLFNSSVNPARGVNSSLNYRERRARSSERRI